MSQFNAMPQLNTAVLALSIGASVLYGVNVHTPPSYFRMSTKTISTTLLSVLAAINNGPWFLIAALALSSTGDAFLAWDGEGVFVCGLASFLAAHTLYIPLFFSSAPNTPTSSGVGELNFVGKILQLSGWRAGVSYALAVLVPAMIVALMPRVGKDLRAPVVVYATAIFVMSLAALTVENSTRVTVGALMFTASDSILASEKFLVSERSKHRAWMPYAVWVLYRSVSGATADHQEIESIARTLRDLSANLEPPQQAGRSSHTINNKHDRQLQRVAKNCHDAADQLLNILAELKAKGTSKLTESFLTTVKAIRKDRKVQQLHKKLLSTRSDLSLCLAAMVHDEHSIIMWALRDLSDKTKSMQINYENSLSSLSRKLERELLYANEIAIDRVTDTLATLVQEAEVSQAQLGILESLRDPIMKMRENNISEAHGSTYQWMLTPESRSPFPDVRFFEWLSEGNGVFWVAGKPGSGKSTLMKFVYTAPETRKRLQRWAGDDRLVVGGHFFWVTGYGLQKSQEGLLRSLLDKILTECPVLMPEIVPERWNNPLQQTDPWTLRELLSTLKRFKDTTTPDTKFCFFIDALDEFDGNHNDLADILAFLCDGYNIKICLSSREWPIFEYYFGMERQANRLPVRKIRLQLYTKDDIRRYIKSRFEKDHRYRRIRASELEEAVSQQKAALVNEMTNRAEGVFLWVSLVCDELLRGFTNLDSLETLRDRLRSLPTDLEKYFLRMIERVEPVYHEQCAQILQTLLVARRPVPARLLDFIENDNRLFGVYSTTKLLPYTDETRAVQIKARGADLIELARRSERTWRFGPDVCFMHRTVHDFLLTPPMQSFLRSKTPTGFNVEAYLCQAYVVQMRLGCGWGVQFDRKELGLILDDVADFLRKLDSQPLQESALLVDGLLTQIPSSYLKQVYSSVSFTSGKSSKQCWFNMLIFAARNGLYNYIGRQLDEKPDLIKGFPDQQPLLYHALAGSAGLDDILKTTQLLLRRGGSPNQALLRGGTCWTHLVEMVNRDRTAQNGQWVDVVATFMDADACDHWFDKPISVT
ncbi:YhhN-like protein-domain-containing protein [Podospora didyma]|uniref:YhhN-like protein-domain-containing protein n=1 Tax=Podospora didyma TaxID=330526 RepID=A0AAE0NV81_9PEZI|nr:YhhN-like protein-domain-containing protein [Podospora didyma]